MQLYRHGDTGAVVAEIRAKLARLDLLSDSGDDHFDGTCDQAVRGFQQARGLVVDGIVGPETYRALEEARWRLGDRILWCVPAHPFVGDDVMVLQNRLLDMGFDPGRCDGVFGVRTEGALRDFQRNVGLAADGSCGPATLRALAQLARAVVGGHPQWMREAEQLHRAGPALAGKLIVLDPGHGGDDPGSTAFGLTESELVEDLGFRVEGRLTAAGANVVLTRDPGTGRTDVERAAFANAMDADLVLSLHMDSDPNPDCHGVAAYYFGIAPAAGAGVGLAPDVPTSPDGRLGGSPMGQRLAALVQREVVARTDLLDCRTHPKTWELLRRTRMPAVRLELGYLSSPVDAGLLAMPGFRDVAAEAVVVAVQRLYLPSDADAPTGSLRIPALTA